MGAAMRAFDWTKTALGAPASWPQSLKTVIHIVLTSRYAMWAAWGPELTFFCNDAYLPTLGKKGAWALGAPAPTVWAEIWSDIGPRIESVLRTGLATYDENLLLFLERSGFVEETYHTFSYSPLADDAGVNLGMLCVVTEVSERLIDERRLALLRDFSAATPGTFSRKSVFKALARVTQDHRDLPFLLVYVFDDDGRGRARLMCQTGFGGRHEAAPETIEPEAPSPPWPAAEVAAGGGRLLVEDLQERFVSMPSGPWPDPPSIAAVFPIAQQAQERPAGFLVAGINPYRPYDAAYAGFLELMVGQIVACLANARAYEEERRRAEALAEIDRAKTAFFSNVSHEFRTPLTLMLGPLEEAMSGARLPMAERSRLEVVHRNGRRLLKLVNSLLDFSRIEAGRAQVAYRPVDLSALTAELASNFRSACERAGLRLDVDCPPLPEPVFVDPDMWEKIVLNLVSNAFKFTFGGEIVVRLRAAGAMAELIVRDSGTGIAAAELPRIFERFHRIEGSRGRSFEGSGIGLALVDDLVKLHGGQISVASQEGVGSTFRVALPFGRSHLPEDKIRVADAAAAPTPHAHIFVEEAMRWLQPADAEDVEMPSSEAMAGAVVQRSRVLVADDNADMRDYVRRLLGGRHDVRTVGDGEAALAAMREARFDLVLSDMMMPRLDGFGLLRAIRQDPAIRETPVIVLSARAGEAANVEGLAAGADDYLAKPFVARELIARVDAALALAKVRRENAEALRESEARFRQMADSAPVVIFMSNIEGKPVYSSKAFFDMTGHATGADLAKAWRDVLHPDDFDVVRGAYRAARERCEGFRIEFRVRRHDGVYRWQLASAMPRYGPHDECIGYIGSLIDISERKAAETAQREINSLLADKVAEAMAERDAIEAQLVQSQKMEAVGRLTGGLAHDFNNLLQVIGGNLQLVAKDVAGNERAQRRLGNALDGVARGAKLASQLLSFGRRQPLEPKVIHIGKLFAGIDDMVRRALGEEVELQTIIADGLWNTIADPSQVENALLNLAINGRDAMGGQGWLTIEAANVQIDAAAAARSAARPGDYVMLGVTDTGCGIPPELIEQVFEPFFTTKPEGRGTGLGLSMVYGFVKQSGGHVAIESVVGQGTTVRMYLPRSRRSEDLAVVADGGPAVGGSETILAVEDDEGVRLTVVEMLSDLGYRVLTAPDAESAMIVIDSGVAVDMLFTDVVMPGMLRSAELARRARQRLPRLKVLFTSGYTDDSIAQDGRLADGADLLNKPYTRETLARKIRSVLSERSQAAEAIVRGVAVPSPARARVLLVAKDGLIRLSTTGMLEGLGIEVVDVGGMKEALEALATQRVDVLLTDVKLLDGSGTELALAARLRLPQMPLIFAADATDAIDLVEGSPLADAVVLRKPFGERELVKAINAVRGHQPLPGRPAGRVSLGR